GMILHPRIATTHIVMLPVTPKEETRAKVLEACDSLALQLRGKRYAELPLEVEVDQRDIGGGVKNWDWIKKGVPLRVEIGPRDVQSGNVAVSRRDQPVKAKEFLSEDEFVARAAEMLDSMQRNLLRRATEFRDANTRVINSREEFYDFFTPKRADKPEIHGGFALAHWNGSRAVEEQIKNDLR